MRSTECFIEESAGSTTTIDFATKLHPSSHNNVHFYYIIHKTMQTKIYDVQAMFGQ